MQEFGIPDGNVFPGLDEALAAVLYEKWAQRDISYAGYWKDPWNLPNYVKHCEFLPDINNEGPTRNATYRAHLLALNAFVMVHSDIDQVIIPRESGWFWFYHEKSHKVVPLRNSTQYLEDWLGLRTLDKRGALHFLLNHVKHQDYFNDRDKSFLFQHVMPFFNNTLP